MTLRKTIDADLFATLKPWPSDEWQHRRADEVVPKEINIINFMTSDHIPIDDRIWAVTCSETFIDGDVLGHYALDNAERIHALCREPVQEIIDFINTTRRFISGGVSREALNKITSQTSNWIRKAERSAPEWHRSNAEWSIEYRLRIAAFWTAFFACDPSSDPDRHRHPWAFYSAERAVYFALDRAEERKWQLKNLIKLLINIR